MYIQDILAYQRRSQHRLSPGLYLGYLKLSSSVDQIKVLVPQRTPSMLCHFKIRDNWNVSRSASYFIHISYSVLNKCFFKYHLFNLIIFFGIPFEPSAFYMTVATNLPASWFSQCSPKLHIFQVCWIFSTMNHIVWTPLWLVARTEVRKQPLRVLGEIRFIGWNAQ